MTLFVLTFQFFIENTTRTHVVFHLFLTLRAAVDDAFEDIHGLRVQRNLALLAVDHKVWFFAILARPLRSHLLSYSVIALTLATEGAFAELKMNVTVVAVERFVKAELLSFESYTTIGTWDILPLHFAMATANHISDLQLLVMIFSLFAVGTICKNQSFATALAFKSRKTLVNDYIFIQKDFSAARTDNTFVFQMADITTQYRSHPVVILSLIKLFLAFYSRTEQIEA